MTVELALGALRAAVDPDLGGALLNWRIGDTDLLRPAPRTPRRVDEAACFALVPYANRIADGRFELAGRAARLPATWPGETHALHGDGWSSRWTVESIGPAQVEMVLKAADSRWPWRYAARQAVRLEPGALVLTIAVTNVDATPGAFGVGLHPYFPAAGSARLTTEVEGVWLTDAARLPVRWTSGSLFADWTRGAAVRGDTEIDNCHTGWSRMARLDLGPERPALALTASEALAFLHVYASPDRDTFCVEPVSHAPNAFNMPDPQSQGVRILAPGETLAAEMRLQIL